MKKRAAAKGRSQRKKQDRKIGRPSKFTKKLADRICERLIGGESLRAICKDPAMPSVVTVFSWIHKNEDFLKQYARAREVQADIIAEDTFDMVDDGSNDFMEKETKSGSIIVLREEHVSRSRLRFDQRRWWLSKVAPKKYGDKLDINGEVTHKFVPLDEVLRRVRERKARAARQDREE